MQLFHSHRNRVPYSRLFWHLIALLCLPSGFGAFAQATNSLNVRIEMSPRDDTTFPAHTNLHIDAFVNMDGPLKNGDLVKVEFFANTNRLGSGTTVWHSAIYPPNTPGQFHYMHIVAAGFPSVPFVWKNPPAGNYTLTAKATLTKSIIAVSPPINIVITP